MSRMKWERAAQEKRLGAMRTVYAAPITRLDETLLRKQEIVGDYDIRMVQINEYRLRRKSFRVEVWSAGVIADEPFIRIEEQSQEAAETRFNELVEDCKITTFDGGS